MTKPEDIYIPNLANGEKLYNEISNNESLVNYYSPIKITYDYHDFTDLVAYERQLGVANKLSAMMVVNLMKGKLLKKDLSQVNLKDVSHHSSYSRTDNIYIYLNCVFLTCCYKVIPKWDYTKGVYFDTFYKNYDNDALRLFVRETNLTEFSTTIDIDNDEENENKPNRDSIDNKILNSQHVHERTSIGRYENPENIYYTKEKKEINNTLFANLEDKQNYAISKEMKVTIAFLSKFLNGLILENRELAELISPKVEYIFNAEEIIKEKSKNDEYEDELKENDDYEDDYDEENYNINYDEDNDYDYNIPINNFSDYD